MTRVLSWCSAAFPSVFSKSRTQEWAHLYEETKAKSLLEQGTEGSDHKFWPNFHYQNVVLPFLIDCSAFCTCSLSFCNLRPIKLLPEAHFERLRSSIFSTELQPDWLHSSEELSGVGLLFQSIPCFLFGGCHCWLVLQSAQEHGVKMK